MQRRQGARLLTRTGGASPLFTRLQQRPRQVITTLDGPTSLSIADKFAAAWSPLLTVSHATCAATDRLNWMTQLFSVPPDHKLDDSDNASLMAPITATEVEKTIAELGAHKAGGADRLNNDFYRAWAPILSEALAQEFNTILLGAEMPPSFRDAVIVPLPNKGASTNAMEYRPISLQSSYKILTKLLAGRLQQSLGRVINADKNGFVRGRDMANNIHLMQAILAQDYDVDDDSAAAAPVAVLLDLKKAYDSLIFLMDALAAFGYDSQFIHLIGRLHTNTTARFLANGDMSSIINVRTGIRQGCPLAPLLFLVAAETLKYAIVQTPGLRGVTITSTGASFTQASRHSSTTPSSSFKEGTCSRQ